MVGPLLEVEMSKKCTPLWSQAHFQVKSVKKWAVRTTFGSWDVEKVHTVVARSTFPSQNLQSTTCTDHFWKLDVEKVRAVGWGAKHISKSKCTKHHTYGPLLTVQMWFCVAGARDRAPCQKWAKREGFVAVSATTTNALRYTTLHYPTLRYTTLNYPYTTLHYTTPQYTTQHSTPLHHATPHYTTLHYTTPHYTTIHYTAPPCTTLHHITLHYTTLHYITVHYATLPSTALDYTAPTTTTTTTSTLLYTTLH